MATTKSKSTKKKAPTKASKTKIIKRSPKQPEMQSFRLERDSADFIAFRFTDQTVYWLIIAMLAIIFTIWVTTLQADINDLYNKLDAINSMNSMN